MLQPVKILMKLHFLLYLHLHTDKEVNVELSFTAPEALTKWKLETLASTKDLSFGLYRKRGDDYVKRVDGATQICQRFSREDDALKIWC